MFTVYKLKITSIDHLYEKSSIKLAPPPPPKKHKPNGYALQALIKIVEQAGAEVVGLVIAIEKAFKKVAILFAKWVTTYIR